jgi:hypothetical protein
VLKIKQLLVLPLDSTVSVNNPNDDYSQVECDTINLSSLTADGSFPLVITSPPSEASDGGGSGANAAATATAALFNAGSSPPQAGLPPPSPMSENSKLEKKLLDEIEKIFQENAGSFYFSYTYDLTNTLERQQEQIVDKNASSSSLKKEEENLLLKRRSPMTICWKNADDRFFWNKSLLEHLIEMSEKTSSSEQQHNELDKFIVPLIQGFVQMETFDNKLPGLSSKSTKQNDPNNNNNKKNTKANTNESRIVSVQKGGELVVQLRLCLISRRSRYRLGMRHFIYLIFHILKLFSRGTIIIIIIIITRHSI